MKILQDLIKKANDTMEEVEWYAEKAHHLRATHKDLADTYAKIGEEHVEIYKMIHDKMVTLIEEERKRGNAPPPAMQAVWDYQHEKLVKEFAEAKFLLDEYKKSY